MTRFAKLRRKLADLILGGQTVLFVSKDQKALMDQNRYLDFDDATLGLMTRRWFQLLDDGILKMEEHDKPFPAIMTSRAVLWLVSLAAKANADTMTITTGGSIDGGRTHGVWQVEVTRMPDDYDFSPEGVTETHDEDGKLVKLTTSIKNPGYDKWLAERAKEREQEGA